VVETYAHVTVRMRSLAMAKIRDLSSPGEKVAEAGS
jgi:hypothetical protein